jgi:hypothetical protein
MDGKWGLALLWGAGLLAAWAFGRDYIHEQFKTMIQNVASQSDTPDFDFNKPLEFTMDQPVFPQDHFYNPDN